MPYGSSPVYVGRGDTIAVRYPTPSTWNTRTTITLNIGTGPDGINFGTRAPDSRPDQFSFIDNQVTTDFTNFTSQILRNTVYYSNAVTISGIENWIPASVSSTSAGAAFQIGRAGIFGDWITSTNDLRNGDTVRLRVTSSSNYSSFTNVTFTASSETYGTDIGAPPAVVSDVWTFRTEVPLPVINSFTVSPDPQTSGIAGAPDNTVTLSYDITTYGITNASINQGVGSISIPVNTTDSTAQTATGSVLVNTGLQSVLGTLSPATKIYTLTATNASGSVSLPATASVYNDNTPNNYTIPSLTTSGVALTNLEPNVSYTINIGNITGLDMITLVQVGGDAGIDASVSGAPFSGSNTIVNGQSLQVRATSRSFNQSPDGLVNTFNFYVIVGTLRKDFQFITRAPDVNETFDFEHEDNKVPFPKIDTTNEASLQFIETDPIVLVDDIELFSNGAIGDLSTTGVELKANNPNVQVKIKKPGQEFGAWVYVRQI